MHCADAEPEDRRMRFRIGVHLGDVIEKADGTVYGDGVNIAARLQALAEPGGITLSESVQVAVRSRIAASFEDLGEQQVKNIAEPIHAYRIAGIAASQPSTAKPPGHTIYDKPSVAVLPFTNMGSDPEQEYFSDGLTEDIITALAAWRLFPVIARNSSFAYKGTSPDVRKVAQELGVRYVLEGSVRKAGNRVRITGQLIDGISGNHLWAERFDRDFNDLFAVQDEITDAHRGGHRARAEQRRDPAADQAATGQLHGLGPLCARPRQHAVLWTAARADQAVVRAGAGGRPGFRGRDDGAGAFATAPMSMPRDRTTFRRRSTRCSRWRTAPWPSTPATSASTWCCAWRTSGAAT